MLPDESRPCGYRVLETVSFDNAGDYREKLESLFRRHAPAGLPRDKSIRIHPEVKVRKDADRILLAGDGAAFRIPDNRWNEAILKGLADGACFAEIFQSLDLSEKFEPDVYAMLDKMFRSGYLV